MFQCTKAEIMFQVLDVASATEMFSTKKKQKKQARNGSWCIKSLSEERPSKHPAPFKNSAGNKGYKDAKDYKNKKIKN